MANLLQHLRRSFTWPYPSNDLFTPQYFSTGYSAPDQEAPPSGFAQFVDGPFKSNPVVFACELKRMQVFSEARFTYRALRDGRPTSHLFGKQSLGILEEPWPRGTTGDLLENMILHADIGGTAFVARQIEEPDRLRLLRPDWTTIVMGDSSGRPVESPSQLDAEIIGLIYDPKDGRTAPEVLLADEVAVWAPIPDPLARFRGMSWLTPILREYQADQAATMHKLAFFQNGATPQVIVSFDAGVDQAKVQAFAEKMNATHSGWQNAYKTLYLGAGATPTVVGADLKQVDFTGTQGKGETRIIAAAGLHPTLLPASEGMQGSSLNAGNYGSVKRAVADTTFRPLWRQAAGVLSMLVDVPLDAELWYDEPNIPFLHEDAKDQAEIDSVKAGTIRQLIDAGVDPKTAIQAVWPDAGLKHTGLTSVQLTPPGENGPDTSSAADPAGNGDPDE